MVATAKRTPVGKTVDRLGEIKAEIANLKKVEDKLREELVALGMDSADGELFHATVSRFDKSTVDWAELRKEYHPPRFLEAIEKHTRTAPVVTVKVFARKS